MRSQTYYRREILKWLGAAGVFAGCTPLSAVFASDIKAASALPRLILFEMFGANDNLNTLVPYKDSLYKHYRPSINLTAKEYTPVTDELAFNNALSPLLPAWEQGQMTVVQDVGYPNSILSHFKSIELIENGLSRTSTKQVGWVANTISRNASLNDKSKWDIESVWAGGHIQSMLGTDIVPFSPTSGVFNKYLNKYNQKDALLLTNRLGNTISGYSAASDALKGRIPEKSRFQKRFHSYDLNEAKVGHQCSDILRLIEGGIQAPAYKLGMSGFDLHSRMRGAHEQVLGRAARYLAKLRQSLIELNEWDNTLIMAYSEFGRRAKENSSGGTDHGTSGPVFLLGGKVKGGIKGRRADLENLNSDGNLHYVTDYREVFSTVVDHWWKADVNQFKDEGFMPLGNIIS